MIAPERNARQKLNVAPEIGAGRSFPLGATLYPDGVNFSVFSRDAATIELLLFDRVGDPKPSRILTFDPRKNRTYHYRHLFVPNLKPGQIYGYRASGPSEPQKGFRFDPEKVLLDPYGRAVAVPENYSRLAAIQPGDDTATAMKSMVVDTGTYDWEGDQPLHRPFAKTVIYARGGRRRANSPASSTGSAQSWASSG